MSGMTTDESKADMSMSERPKRGVPEGLWMRCPQCKATIFRKEAEARLNVCPECTYHFYLPARDRIAQLLDADSFEEWFTDLRPCDPLEFKDRLPYAERLQAEQAKTGMLDAVLRGPFSSSSGIRKVAGFALRPKFADWFVQPMHRVATRAEDDWFRPRERLRHRLGEWNRRLHLIGMPTDTR